MHLSSVFWIISIHLSFVPYLMYFFFYVFRNSYIPRFIYSAFYVFRVSSLSRLILIDTLSVSCFSSDCVLTIRSLRVCFNIWIFSQVIYRLHAISRNQLFVTKIEIRENWRNKMNIERVDILYSVEQSDQSLMRLVEFNPFIDEIFALLFDKFSRYFTCPKPLIFWINSWERLRWARDHLH